MLTYGQTVDYLFSRLPMFHRIGPAALKPGLDNIWALCELLGNPQNDFPIVHIAGTNGKGSTTHFLASVLQEAGYHVGLYTSPHLKDFRERIKINGEMIPEAEVCQFVDQYREAFEEVDASFFEYTTAMSFWYFKTHKVDIAIIETGLGGRLDSTNIVKPLLTAITSVSYDHMHLLGDTLEAIASEKAGIIKSNTPVVLAKNPEEVKKVVEHKALSMHAPFYCAETLALPPNLQPGLLGNYQHENIQTVLALTQLLQNLSWKIGSEHFAEGIKNVVSNTHFSGRWQILQEKPKIICDVAHNSDGIVKVVEQLMSEEFEEIHIVFGMVDDKDHHKVLSLLPKKAKYYFCKANMPRALESNRLLELAQQYQLRGKSYPTVSEAFNAAKKESRMQDLIFVGGSVFVVAEIL